MYLKDLGNDKLIYDARSGRFYEKKIEEVCREEYCAIDETTGEVFFYCARSLVLSREDLLLV